MPSKRGRSAMFNDEEEETSNRHRCRDDSDGSGDDATATVAQRRGRRSGVSERKANRKKRNPFIARDAESAAKKLAASSSGSGNIKSMFMRAQIDESIRKKRRTPSDAPASAPAADDEAALDDDLESLLCSLRDEEEGVTEEHQVKRPRLSSSTNQAPPLPSTPPTPRSRSSLAAGPAPVIAPIDTSSPAAQLQRRQRRKEQRERDARRKEQLDAEERKRLLEASGGDLTDEILADFDEPFETMAASSSDVNNTTTASTVAAGSGAGGAGNASSVSGVSDAEASAKLNRSSATIVEPWAAAAAAAAASVSAASAGDWLEYGANETESVPDVVAKNNSGMMSTIDDLPEVDVAGDEQGAKALRFYWLDAWDDSGHHPGTVFLFGKVAVPLSNGQNKFESCCVKITDIPRQLYFLPRQFRVDRHGDPTDQPVQIKDVYDEFAKFAAKHGINSFKCRTVRKGYCFSVADVPPSADWLEVLYPADKPAFPADAAGLTYSHVFGCNTSSLETLILDRQLYGPCWLDISGAKRQLAQFSWCKIDATLNDHRKLKKTPTDAAQKLGHPPLTVATLYTVACDKEVACLALLIDRQFRIDGGGSSGGGGKQQQQKQQNCRFQRAVAVVARPQGCAVPFGTQAALTELLGSRDNASLEAGERALLGRLLGLLHQADPDVLVGFDCGASLAWLLHRLAACRVPHWHKLGRLRRNGPPQRAPGLGPVRHAVAGRLLLDCLKSAKELVKGRSYDLDELSESLLKRRRAGRDWSAAEVREAFSGGRAEGVRRLVESALNDSALCLNLAHELQALPLSLQITQIVGNLWSRTLLLNMPLLNAANQQNKAEYTGGLVLEPKRGLHDKFILLLDFNSLYPSIIQEFNLCFTTLQHRGLESGDRLPELPDRGGSEAGVLPQVIGKLVETRRAVKSLLKDPKLRDEQRVQLDIRQKALKLTANSLYGCLGFQQSRFAAKPIAALALKIGAKVKAQVNKLYRLLELEIDGVYRPMLLCRKKKYAALTVTKGANGELTYQREVKGLEIVRRDWSRIATGTASRVLDLILANKPRETLQAEIREILIGVADGLKNNRVPMEQLSIAKMLTKAPEEYRGGHDEHVAAALRDSTGRRYKKGDTVEYLVAAGDGPVTSRVHTLAEWRKMLHANASAAAKDSTNAANKSAPPSVDWEHYLVKEVLPLVSRLTESLQEVDPGDLADCVGVDSRAFRRRMLPAALGEDGDDGEGETAGESVLAKPEVRFELCEPLTLPCRACRRPVEPAKLESGGQSQDELCPHCRAKAPLPDEYAASELLAPIERHIRRYYRGEFVCDDQACQWRTRRLISNLDRGRPRCPACVRGHLQRSYCERQLYTQLCAYDYWTRKVPALNSVVREALQANAYGCVDLDRLFVTAF
uniref:DNA polymerase alpha catalytic subunit n=1 Tax=Macrostomum lignano TaxID=282301 RepID=A0A1I8HZL7_9PLAT